VPHSVLPESDGDAGSASGYRPPFPLAVEIQLCRQPKVANFDFHVVVEEQVAQLQVAVDHSIVVQVLAGGDNLEHVVSGFWLSDSSSSLVQLHQRLEISVEINTKISGKDTFVLQTLLAQSSSKM